MSDGQYDLFGEVAAAEEAAARRRIATEKWRASFERAEWVAPWDCADGTPKGTVLNGWRCPDPECRQVAPNSFLLSINHGFDPEIPGHQPFDGRCITLRLLAAQAKVVTWRADSS